MLTKEDFALILRCTLFQGFTERSLSEVLNWLGAFERSYHSGEMVFLIGDPMRYAGILLKGTVSVSFWTKAVTEQVRREKATKRGGFERRLLLREAVESE